MAAALPTEICVEFFNYSSCYVVHGKGLPPGFIVLLMLSVDSLNPVQILCFVSRGWICEQFVAILAAIGLIALAVNQFDRLFYESVKLFFKVNMHNVFFKSVANLSLRCLTAF